MQAIKGIHNHNNLIYHVQQLKLKTNQGYPQNNLNNSSLQLPQLPILIRICSLRPPPVVGLDLDHQKGLISHSFK